MLRRLVEEDALVRTLRRGASRTKLAWIDEHVAALRKQYAAVLQETASRARQIESDADELEVLHRALLGHGFGRLARTDALAMPTRGGFR